ncbi:ABC transporter substrate-binding protein [Inquilinus limosus]|uniref:ABC transporter substrate-binding protein n=1 Tax=Inquilinus limosus MP06 TaxID=1398085 RepID=A0A0A0D3Q1_9PROT|nr:ABC transporter substrate-binding protein [Inquilinus limosus]KGM32428.1 ABC transporter substrate-binding protein [Inquilinus limosus MP06]
MIGRSGRTAALAAALMSLVVASPALAAGLRIGLDADPDVLDPAQGGSVSGRQVFAAMCDKLVGVAPGGGFRPELATKWDWSADGKALTLTLRDGVLFQDGEPLDAAAVKVNLDRYRTAPISRRKSELKPVADVTAVDRLTVKITLAQPYAPLVAVLSDRAGMMLSPKALAQAGDGIGQHPVCAGPFEFVERQQGDHILLKRFDRYWNRDAVFLDSVTYRPMPDETVRLLNLRSGDLDLIEHVPTVEVAALRDDPAVTVVDAPSIAYDLITFNIGHGDKAKSPIGQDARVRRALELSLDRDAINAAAYEGMFIPGNQPEVPGTTFEDPGHPMPARDVDKAKALLAEAGVPNPSFTLLVTNSPVTQQVGQMIQAMAGEAGFDIKLQALEAATLAASADAGDFQAAIAIWSGRLDPDANMAAWAGCDAFQNWGRYCNRDFDAVLAQARATTDQAARVGLYRQAAGLFLADLPQIVLYHYRSVWGMRRAVQGFTPYPDGLMRLQGVKIAG